MYIFFVSSPPPLLFLFSLSHHSRLAVVGFAKPYSCERRAVDPLSRETSFTPEVLWSLKWILCKILHKRSPLGRKSKSLSVHWVGLAMWIEMVRPIWQHCHLPWYGNLPSPTFLANGSIGEEHDEIACSCRTSLRMPCITLSAPFTQHSRLSLSLSPSRKFLSKAAPRSTGGRPGTKHGQNISCCFAASLLVSLYQISLTLSK